MSMPMSERDNEVCFHGGASFESIGADFGKLDRVHGKDVLGHNRCLRRSRHIRLVTTGGKTDRTPNHGRRRSHRVVRLRRQRLLKATIRHGVRPHGSDWPATGRSAASRRSSGRTMARGAANRQPECSYLLSPTADTGDGDSTTGLRICV